ncbi:FixH family protein [Qipengyuania sp. ASV99]|uniref:FixH family protein n=1 Tax=Qipengyuania sp. ASV99 TaxID=3399681 RepID=UPI003A4C737E
MADTQGKGSFTGRHMALAMIGGFGIVIAVNFTMASLAVGGFHGVVVENSYVASQRFNGWLAQAEASRALGWTAEISRDEGGFVMVSARDLPAGAAITAQLRRPLGAHEFAAVTFEPAGTGLYRSTKPVAEGRWTLRLYIEAGDQRWAQESELK